MLEYEGVSLYFSDSVWSFFSGIVLPPYSRFHLLPSPYKENIVVPNPNPINNYLNTDLTFKYNWSRHNCLTACLKRKSLPTCLNKKKQLPTMVKLNYDYVTTAFLKNET